MKATALKNMTVVSMSDGVRVGSVEDVLFDTAALRVSALALTTSGGRSILPFSSVRSIGADAVTIESENVAQAAAAQGSAGNVLRGLDDLLGLKVVSGEGTHLGDVREAIIDQASGAVTELEAHRGGILGVGGTSVIIPASAIRGIGPDLVTADLPPQQSEEKGGGGA